MVIFVRPFCYASTKHVPRVVAAHGMEAALHVNNASGHTLADAVRGAPPETHSSEGGGVWAEYLPKAALMSNNLFLDDVNALVPVWLPWRPPSHRHWTQQGFTGGTYSPWLFGFTAVIGHAANSSSVAQ